MKAYGKNIFFKPFPPKDTTDGGLIVPDSVKQVNNKGVVVSIGDKVTKVKEGDVVFRVKDWGTEFAMAGEQYFMMEESAILAKA